MMQKTPINCSFPKRHALLLFLQCSIGIIAQLSKKPLISDAIIFANAYDGTPNERETLHEGSEQGVQAREGGKERVFGVGEPNSEWTRSKQDNRTGDGASNSQTARESITVCCASVGCWCCTAGTRGCLNLPIGNLRHWSTGRCLWLAVTDLADGCTGWSLGLAIANLRDGCASWSLRLTIADLGHGSTSWSLRLTIADL